MAENRSSNEKLPDALAISSKEGDAISSSSSPVVNEKFADETLQFVQQHEASFGPLTKEREDKLRRKLYWWLVGTLGLTNLMLFIDKASLSYATLLGVYKETKLNDTEYNNLNTIFYVGYLLAQWPGHLLMQRLPLGKYVAGSVFIWSIIIFLHCVAKDYGDLMAFRFFLGAIESTIVPAIEITFGMFFKKDESAFIQPIFWTSCMGSSIPAGLIAYGLLYSKSTSVLPWKFFMIITGGLTFLLSIFCFFYYPNNPSTARFLTLEERVYAVRRIHADTRGSIQQKYFKKSQFLETMKDPVSWLFGLQALTLMIANNLTYQQNLLFVAIGVSNLGSTLTSVAGGSFTVVACIVATFLIRRFPNNNAYWATFWCMPAVAAGIGMVTIAWEKHVALLACILIASGLYGISYIIALSWATQSASGYTKKLTRNVFFMLGYSVGNLISPQIWAASDKPRYYPAWILQIVVSWVGTPVILLVIRWILKRRNDERQVWIADREARGIRQEGWTEVVDETGEKIKVKVDIALLDLTDMENKYFIYPL